MSDGAYAYLIAQLAHIPGRKIWFAEESCGEYLPALAAFKEHLLVITHRVDIYQQASKLGMAAQLNDATWPPVDAERELISSCFLRIGKEKPWVHHIINQARQFLPAKGQLLIAGCKQEGIKTFADKAAGLFNSPQKACKNGDFYTLQLIQPEAPAEHFLPCENYAEFRPVLTLNARPVLSKPGIYGWNKIDRGSQLLIQTLGQEQLPACAQSLDLGCGYGYLTLAAADLPLGLRTCTDNNAAAIQACKRNCQAWGIEAQMILADCGEGLKKDYDVILCNPPFHQGFEVENQLTERFLAAAARLLRTPGAAYFVVNQFIALERKAENFFKNCQKITGDGHFKIVRLTQPKY